MAVYNPEIYLSKEDRELLKLLAQLLIDARAVRIGDNQPIDATPLSDAEAKRLIILLELFVGSRKFREGAFFVDALVGPNLQEKAAREIYLGWRTRYGKTRAVATAQWENFLARIGLVHHTPNYPRVWFRPEANPMDFDYFLRMERKLANTAGLSPRVVNLILEFVEARRAAIERIRSRAITLPEHAVEKEPKQILDQLKYGSNPRFGHKPMSSQKIASVMTIVLDFSTMFTTRDWSVAGFMSTIAGSIPISLTED